MCDRSWFDQIVAAVARQGLAPAKRALWLVARGAWLPVLLVLSCLLYKRRLRWRSVTLVRDAKVDATARLSPVASRVQRLRFNPSRTLPVTMVRERLQPHSVAPRPPSSNLNPEAWCGVSCCCCAWLGLPVLMHVTGSYWDAQIPGELRARSGSYSAHMTPGRPQAPSIRQSRRF